jgi:hypothetical protein
MLFLCAYSKAPLKACASNVGTVGQLKLISWIDLRAKGGTRTCSRFEADSKDHFPWYSGVVRIISLCDPHPRSLLVPSIRLKFCIGDTWDYTDLVIWIWVSGSAPKTHLNDFP